MELFRKYNAMSFKDVKEECTRLGISCCGLHQEYVRKLVSHEMERRVRFSTHSQSQGLSNRPVTILPRALNQTTSRTRHFFSSPSATHSPARPTRPHVIIPTSTLVNRTNSRNATPFSVGSFALSESLCAAPHSTLSSRCPFSEIPSSPPLAASLEADCRQRLDVPRGAPQSDRKPREHRAGEEAAVRRGQVPADEDPGVGSFCRSEGGAEKTVLHGGLLRTCFLPFSL